MSESISLTEASSKVFPSITAIALFLGYQVVNMECHSFKSEACWQREFTTLPVPLMKEVK